MTICLAYWTVYRFSRTLVLNLGGGIMGIMHEMQNGNSTAGTSLPLFLEWGPGAPLPSTPSSATAPLLLSPLPARNLFPPTANSQVWYSSCFCREAVRGIHEP